MAGAIAEASGMKDQKIYPVHVECACAALEAFLSNIEEPRTSTVADHAQRLMTAQYVRAILEQQP
jgi:hypothetical protein